MLTFVFLASPLVFEPLLRQQGVQSLPPPFVLVSELLPPLCYNLHLGTFLSPLAGKQLEAGTVACSPLRCLCSPGLTAVE